jgi:hypothetical protein
MVLIILLVFVSASASTTIKHQVADAAADSNVIATPFMQ